MDASAAPLPNCARPMPTVTAYTPRVPLPGARTAASLASSPLPAGELNFAAPSEPALSTAEGEGLGGRTPDARPPPPAHALTFASSLVFEAQRGEAGEQLAGE